MRTHRLSADIPYWRGLLGTWSLVCAEAMREVELRATPGSARVPDEPLASFSATVTYEDGDEKFATVEALKAAATRIDPKAIRDVSATASTYHAAAKHYDISLHAWQHSGVHVYAEAEDEPWVRGIVHLYRDRLAMGEVSEYADHRRPYTVKEILLTTAAAAVSVALLGMAAVVDITFLPVALYGIVSIGIIIWLGNAFGFLDRKVRNPHVLFIGPADRLPSPIHEGPVWKLQRWLQNHPVAQKLLEWTMAGTVGAALAKLIG